MGSSGWPATAPLAELLPTIATIQALHDAGLVAEDEERDAISARTMQAIEVLQEQLRRVPAAPARAPLADAVASGRGAEEGVVRTIW